MSDSIKSEECVVCCGIKPEHLIPSCVSWLNVQNKELKLSIEQIKAKNVEFIKWLEEDFLGFNPTDEDYNMQGMLLAVAKAKLIV